MEFWPTNQLSGTITSQANAYSNAIAPPYFVGLYLGADQANLVYNPCLTAIYDTLK